MQMIKALLNSIEPSTLLLTLTIMFAVAMLIIIYLFYRINKTGKQLIIKPKETELMDDDKTMYVDAEGSLHETFASTL